ncbi:MAG: thiamine phosphate synthase [Phycisphaerales bacterium]|nr:thiamine phosphate synthase [Phycisphaerales bacterium]
MDSTILRIIDANLNRAKEGLRVVEEYARLMLEDAALCEQVKGMRHQLAAVSKALGLSALLEARDIRNDVGTQINTETERSRADPADVAKASAKRVTEALRCIEEYCKIIDKEQSARVEQLRYQTYALEQAVFIGGSRRKKLRRSRLHVLITESLCRGPWLSICEQTLRGGADVIQLREKSLNDNELLSRAKRLRELTRKFDVLFIINDRADIARLAGADGVHLGQSDLSVSDARRIAGPHLLVGKSTHSISEAEAALAERADYIGVGPMFASRTKPEVTVQGPELLRKVVAMAGPQMMDVPIVAIGGLTVENVSSIMQIPNRSNAVQVAICQRVINNDNPTDATAALKETLTIDANVVQRQS